jgi:thioredoxin reductase
MHDVLIIGAGPAGLAAALQLKRYGIDFILLERGRVGGLLNNANLVENYPGFPGGLPGEKLVGLFKNQIAQLGVEVTCDDVISLKYEDDVFTAVGNNDNYQAPMAIVATGTRGKYLDGLVIPDVLKDKVMTEILAIMQVENKSILIIGAGDLAFDYALNLGKKNRIVILNRSKDVKCLPLLQNRIARFSSVKYQEQTQVEGLLPGANGQVRVRTSSAKGSQSISCDYIISAIGREPNLGFFSDELRTMTPDLEKREILYLIGDVKNGMYRQAAIASGDGIKCAMKIYSMLKEKRA